MELAIKQTDRWRSAKKEDIEDAVVRKSFDEPINMRVFAWNKNRYIDTIMTPLDSLKYHKQTLQTGFLAIDPNTGEVKAWVGGVDFKTFKYDHVNINTRRQVGSTIKPLLYSLWVWNGSKYIKNLYWRINANGSGLSRIKKLRFRIYNETNKW